MSHRLAAVGDQLQVVRLATTGLWPGYLMLFCVHSVMSPRAGLFLPLASVQVAAVLPLEGQHGKQ